LEKLKTIPYDYRFPCFYSLDTELRALQVYLVSIPFDGALAELRISAFVGMKKKKSFLVGKVF